MFDLIVNGGIQSNQLTALQFLLNKLFDNKRTFIEIKVNPINSVQDYKDNLTRVLDSVSKGDLSVESAKLLVELMAAKVEAIDSTETVGKLNTHLEKQGMSSLKINDN